MFKWTVNYDEGFRCAECGYYNRAGDVCARCGS